mgnify:FL=1
MNKKLLQILACPLCKGRLKYNKKRAELECTHDNLAFPVRAGVPVLLKMDARRITVKNK